MSVNVVFMGSPEFAAPVLSKLTEQYRVVGVATQPDRPAGRGRALTPPPIKVLAIELGLPFIQPNRLKEPEAMAQLHRWAPDLIVVAAFGQILRPEVLELPRLGCINVHASLLPRWRGAAPIQAAIINGDEHTGITIMRMDTGIDTGPTLGNRTGPIKPDDTAASLATTLSCLGADLLMEILPLYLQGSLLPHPQDDTLATYAPMIKKEQGLLNFSSPAFELERKIRAYNPWPGAFTYWNDQILKIHHSHVANEACGLPGRRIIIQGLPALCTIKGLLVLDELQLAGRNAQDGRAFLQGARNWVE